MYKKQGKVTKKHYVIDSSHCLSFGQDNTQICVNGSFEVDAHQRLVFWLNEPVSLKRRYDLPAKIVFEGSWNLDENHDLLLVLDETPSHYAGDRLSIKGEIVSFDGNSLLFQCSSFDKGGNSHIRLLRFGGHWQSDEYNRLTFVFTRKTHPGALTLQGIWQLNENQQIIYNYEKTDLLTREKKSCRLTFEGFWQITTGSRLRYILEGDSESFFDFRVQLETPTVYPQKGMIKYRIGIGLTQKKALRERIVSLYGAWKFERRFGVAFEMDMGRGKIQKIQFDTRLSLTDKDEIGLSLFNARGEPLGLQIRCTHQFLKDSGAHVFLQLKKTKQEAVVESGVRIPF